MRRKHFFIHAGFGLVELTVSLALSALVVVLATRLVMQAATTANVDADLVTLHETGRAALDNIAASIRQAGYQHAEQLTDGRAGALQAPEWSIRGIDDATVSAASTGLQAAGKSTSHASDALALRFDGAGNDNSQDAPLHCAGLAPASAGHRTGWSIYYVATDRYGTPNLYCKYVDRHFTAHAIAAGVESLQVQYRLDNPVDGCFYLDASDINRLDAALPQPQMATQSHWRRVSAIRIAVLVRGTVHARQFLSTAPIRLIDDHCTRAGNAGRNGHVIMPQALASGTADVPRAVFRSTIYLRNRPT